MIKFPLKASLTQIIDNDHFMKSHYDSYHGKKKPQANCLNCSVGKPRLRELSKKKYVGFRDLPEKATAIYDIEIDCEYRDPLHTKVEYNCPEGDHSTKGMRCSTCKYSNGPYELVKYNQDDSKCALKTIHTFYQCVNGHESGEYFRASCRCDKYEKQEEEG